MHVRTYIRTILSGNVSTVSYYFANDLPQRSSLLVFQRCSSTVVPCFFPTVFLNGVPLFRRSSSTVFSFFFNDLIISLFYSNALLSFFVPTVLLSPHHHLHRQDSLKHASLTLATSDTGERSVDSKQSPDDTAHNRAAALIQRMESEMSAKFDLHPRTATVGAKAAMRLMTGLKRRQAREAGLGAGAGAGGGGGTGE